MNLVLVLELAQEEEEEVPTVCETDELFAVERCAKLGEAVAYPLADAGHQELVAAEAADQRVPSVVSWRLVGKKRGDPGQTTNQSGSNSPPGPYFDFIIIRYPSSLQRS